LSGKIILLPPDLTNKIAAGEVIERPASIVKELLENAMDAGATDIMVELRKGGCGSIRVSDNGEGIDPEDAALAFSRYATSKIYHFDDIYKVHSFGFRGEALPSIASISRVEMVTRKKGALAGSRVIAEAGDVKEITETGCPEGTSIFVSKIFEPVPVRRKFLKSQNTEQGYCMDVIARLALSHANVRFTVMADGREILNVPSAKDPGERLSIVLGTDFLDEMIPLSAERRGIRLQGFASRPPVTRANAKHIYSFVNGRFIRDHLINHAIMTSYRNMIEAKRFPVVVIMLELSPENVDVNVHPAKLEVRFLNPRDVYEAVVEALTCSLTGALPLAMTGRGDQFPKMNVTAERGYRNRVEEALKRYTISSGGGAQYAFNKNRTIQGTSQAEEINLFNEAGKVSEQGGMLFSNLNYIGQISDTYLIFAAGDRMIIIDQHAAHERMLFENLKKKDAASDHRPASQRLLVPEVISLPPRDIALIHDCLPILQECGFEMEPFGGDTVVLKAVPTILSLLEPKRIINDFLEEFTESEVSSLDEKKEKIFAFLACKGAVKAHHTLSPAEIAIFCMDLDKIPSILSCPHGRPVFLSFTFHDLEKMFKRR
jgi:DNA mismatch repair protein MutL